MMYQRYKLHLKKYTSLLHNGIIECCVIMDMSTLWTLTKIASHNEVTTPKTNPINIYP